MLDPELLSQAIVTVAAFAASQGKYRKMKAEDRKQKNKFRIRNLDFVMDSRLRNLRTTDFRNNKTAPPLLAFLN
jgi:hypothetical protein